MEGGILPSRQELLSRVELVCELDSSFVALTGDAGIGKSALLEYFIEQHCHEHRKCFVQASIDHPPGHVKEQILFQLFGDQTIDSQQTLAQHFAGSHFEEFHRILIIIDNGEYIDGILLNELMELLATPIDNFQASVIIAQVPDQERFSQINASQPLIEIHIEPLNKAESRMLLEYHYAHMMDTDRSEVQRFIERCDGHPGKLLKWQDGLEKRPKGNKQTLVLTLAAAVLIAVAGAATWYFTGTTKDTTELQVEQLREKVKQQEQAAAEQTQTELVDNGGEISEQAAGQGTADQVNEADAEPESVVDELIAQKWDTEAQKPYVEQAIKDAAAQAAAEEAEQNAKQAQQQDAGEQLNQTSSVQAQEGTEQATQAQTAVAVSDEPEKPLEERLEAQSQSSVDEPVVDSDKVTESKAQTTQPDSQTQTAATLLDKMDNQWFMAQNASSVVLQLTGVSNKNTLQSYLSYHKLGENAHVYQSLRNDKPWYVVTYGIFDSLEDANAAKAQLPATLNNGQPWAKRIRTIQTELLNADKKSQ